MTQVMQIAALALATLGTGAATMSVLNEDIPDLEVPQGAWAVGHELDGLTFQIEAYHAKSGAMLEDDIVFRDGKFQSVDCQNYCDFGWNDYQTMVVNDVVHFTVRMICPEAPHTVVWYGRVAGDRVSLDVSWTTRRWYWTNQIQGSGEGHLVPDDPAGISG